MWSDGGKPTPQAISLLTELRQCAERGMNPEDYSADRLADTLAGLTGAAPPAPATPSPAQWAAFDAALTNAGLRFLSDLHYGRVDPAAVGHNLTVDRVNLDLTSALERLAGAADVSAALDALEPQFRHYALLKHQLSRYRVLAGEEGINDLPPLPRQIGETRRRLCRRRTARAPVCRARRRGARRPHPARPTPAAAANADSRRWSRRSKPSRPGTARGPTAFWARRPSRELTRPLDARVRQIELTMERWRWLPPEARERTHHRQHSAIPPVRVRIDKRLGGTAFGRWTSSSARPSKPPKLRSSPPT